MNPRTQLDRLQPLIKLEVLHDNLHCQGVLNIPDPGQPLHSISHSAVVPSSSRYGVCQVWHHVGYALAVQPRINLEQECSPITKHEPNRGKEECRRAFVFVCLHGSPRAGAVHVSQPEPTGVQCNVEEVQVHYTKSTELQRSLDTLPCHEAFFGLNHISARP
jgi:hypothetical protein